MCFYYVTFSPSQDGIRFPKQHFIGQSLKLLLFSFFFSVLFDFLSAFTPTRTQMYRFVFHTLTQQTIAHAHKMK